MKKTKYDEFNALREVFSGNEPVDLAILSGVTQSIGDRLAALLEERNYSELRNMSSQADGSICYLDSKFTLMNKDLLREIFETTKGLFNWSGEHLCKLICEDAGANAILISTYSRLTRSSSRDFCFQLSALQKLASYGHSDIVYDLASMIIEKNDRKSDEYEILAALVGCLKKGLPGGKEIVVSCAAKMRLPTRGLASQYDLEIGESRVERHYDILNTLYEYGLKDLARIVIQSEAPEAFDAHKAFELLKVDAYLSSNTEIARAIEKILHKTDEPDYVIKFLSKLDDIEFITLEKAMAADVVSMLPYILADMEISGKGAAFTTKVINIAMDAHMTFRNDVESKAVFQELAESLADNPYISPALYRRSKIRKHLLSNELSL